MLSPSSVAGIVRLPPFDQALRVMRRGLILSPSASSINFEMVRAFRPGATSKDDVHHITSIGVFPRKEDSAERLREQEGCGLFGHQLIQTGLQPRVEVQLTFATSLGWSVHL